MTDIPPHILSKAKEIYESNWPDPVLAIAEALMKASNTTPAQKAGDGSLKPCPFCGTDDHLYPAHHHLGHGKPYAIDCVRCGYDFTPRTGFDVVAMWNRRADDPQSMTSEALAAHIAELQLVLNGKREIESL